MLNIEKAIPKENNIIVYDVGLPAFRNNRILDLSYAKQFPGASLIPTLRDFAALNGWRVMTGDVFLSTKPKAKRTVCLSNERTPELKELLNRNVEPGVLISGESPNVAWSFYHNLTYLSTGFRHACLFRGVLDRIHIGTKCHHHYWPMPPIQIKGININYSERRLLAMVSSFKERYGLNRERILSRIISPLRWLKIFWYQIIDSQARFPDLYKTRLEAICAFSSKDNFYLFGRQWDIAIKYYNTISCLNFANRPVACDNKHDTLRCFRFTLVFENCIFPGYVTEKIFDAMLAGSVPVYLGAPDIEDFVPIDCFVDFRNYDDFDDLWRDISMWSEKKWNDTIIKINNFLESDRYAPFKEDNVAQKLFQLLTE